MRRTSISLPEQRYQQARENAKAHGHEHSFSAYIAWLIKQDSEGAVKPERLFSDALKEEAQEAQKKGAREMEIGKSKMKAARKK